MNIKFNVKTKIRFNGQEYAGVETMPPEVRQAYERAVSGAHVYRSTKLTFNGQTYGSVDEMPADVRSQYEQVIALVDKNQNGIPDVLETGRAAAIAPSSDSTLVEAAPLISKPAPANENKGRALTMILLGVLVLAILVVLLILVRAGLH